MGSLVVHVILIRDVGSMNFFVCVFYVCTSSLGFVFVGMCGDYLSYA